MRLAIGGNFLISAQVLRSLQVRFSVLLKLGCNLKKSKGRIFVVNFGINVGRNFVVFVKHLIT